MYRSPEGARGFLLAIGLLGGSLLLAFLGGLGLYWLLQAAVPTDPDHPHPRAWILLLSATVLVPLLILVARRFPFITDWYYLLPAIVFLLAFTVYPILLTILYGFTDYSGIKNGKPDRASETQVVRLEGKRLTLGAVAAESLRCEQPDCAQENLELTRGNERVRVKVVRAEGQTIELASTPAFTPEFAYSINAYRFVGFKNYVEIFSRAGAVLWPVFVWNVIFAAGAVAVGAIPGLILGLLLNNKELKLRGFYRTLLIVSWAMPIVISYQILGAMLNVNFGSINRLFGLLGSYPIPWTSDPEWAKVAVFLASMWAGFPYWMTATLSALSTIPDDVYEAAKMDGANPLQTLTGITLPLIRLPFIPLILGSFAFNFNNFSLIYLLINPQPGVEGRPSTAQAVDILISWAYKTAFQADGGQAYGLGGAISVIIFVITVFISLVNFRLTGALREVR